MYIVQCTLYTARSVVLPSPHKWSKLPIYVEESPWAGPPIKSATV
jgi:hypothetical protein